MRKDDTIFTVAVAQAAPVFLNRQATVEKARPGIFKFKVNRKANRIMKTQDPDTDSSIIEEQCDG